MPLEFPPVVRSGVSFVFFITLKGAVQLFFLPPFPTISEVGNSRLHGTLFNYSIFYGMVR